MLGRKWWSVHVCHLWTSEINTLSNHKKVTTQRSVGVQRTEDRGCISLKKTGRLTNWRQRQSAGDEEPIRWGELIRNDAADLRDRRCKRTIRWRLDPEKRERPSSCSVRDEWIPSVRGQGKYMERIYWSSCSPLPLTWRLRAAAAAHRGGAATPSG